MAGVSAVALTLMGLACGSGDEAATGFSNSTGGSSGSGGSGAIGGASGSGGSGGSAGQNTGGQGADSQGGSGGSAGNLPTGAPYPIVFAHGFFGTDYFAGLDFISYFYEVKDHLATQGEAQVFTPAVDPFNTSQMRGEQLAMKVQEILAQTGAEKVNIIGHSQGGLDARVVATMMPDKVASVTTISTPHNGSPVSELVMGLVSDPFAQQIIDEIINLAGEVLYDAQGNETSLFTAIKQFSTNDITTFNSSYPNQPGVQYYSIAGRSRNHNGSPHCVPDMPLGFILQWNEVVDPIEPLLSITGDFLRGTEAQNYANDGMVRVKDARWGTFLGCIPGDHVDEVGHLFADSPGGDNTWNHKDFYTNLVAFLRTKGL